MRVPALWHLWFWFSVWQAAVSAQPTYKGSVDLVRVTATVTTDGGRRHIGGLSRADFVILDGGREQQIVAFSAERQPVSVVFLVDVSASMQGRAYDHARRALRAFVADHFQPADEALVCVFNTQTTCANRWSRDADALLNALLPIVPEGPTRLYDAVAFVLPLFQGARHPKQVLVILSDGHDVSSELSGGSVSAQLRQTDVMAYAIAFPSSQTRHLAAIPGKMPGEQVLNLPSLRGLTNATGGTTFPVSEASRIGEAVGRIVRDFESQYLLGYLVPEGRPGYRAIDVKLRERSYDVRARRGYTVR
jgi:VWFA-related protein